MANRTNKWTDYNITVGQVLELPAGSGAAAEQPVLCAVWLAQGNMPTSSHQPCFATATKDVAAVVSSWAFRVVGCLLLQHTRFPDLSKVDTL